MSHLLLTSFDLVANASVDRLAQQTLNGLTLGAVYALIALGYSMVYGVLKLLNFAHGDVFMVGAFIGFGMLQWLGFRGEAGAWAPVLSTWFVLLVVFLVSMAGTAGLGVAIERFAYRPLRNAPRIAPLISALGVSFFIAYSMQLMFGAQQRDYNVFGIDNGKLFLSGWGIPGTTVQVPLVRILIIATAIALMFVLWFLVARTRTGKAMRATSYDREAAAMMGIDIDRVIVFTFILGSALAGAAGVMFALRAPASVTMGFIAGLKGFTAAVIGGIGSIPGAMGGGFILGLAEAYTQGYISSQWSDLFVFVILIAFMLFRPQGLFGKKDVNKV